MCELDF